MMIIEESMSNGSLDSFLRVSLCSGLEKYKDIMLLCHVMLRGGNHRVTIRL